MSGLGSVISQKIELLFTNSLLTARLFTPVSGEILRAGTITRIEILMKIICASLDETVTSQKNT
jgi:hypothetical protein